jgi:signal transduction histidine kinase
MLLAEPLPARRLYAGPMVGQGLRAFWDEPRPAHPPIRVWRDWALLGVVAAASALEVVLREDRAWLWVALTVSALIALALLWRRTRPLASVAVAFGTLTAFDLARIVVVDATALYSVAASLVLAYALLRWGSGREATFGIAIILAWLAVTHVADPTDIGEVVAGYGFFLFAAALGASIRFHARLRLRDIEQAKLRERNELARELHDTVGHHVSAIAVQAQAGRAVAASDPARALSVLETIEDAASRTLDEMRAMLGMLRDGTDPELAPSPGIGDIERLARDTGRPHVRVHTSGEVDGLAPSVGAAMYRIAQEAVTNALRHAPDATQVTVEVDGHADQLRLTVRDDGQPVTAGDSVPGYGLVGMSERAALFGGTLRAGPAPEGGWLVEATLPKHGPTPARPHAAKRSS